MTAGKVGPEVVIRIGDPESGFDYFFFQTWTSTSERPQIAFKGLNLKVLG